MLYVERNQEGEIVAVRREANSPGMEAKGGIDHEILEFLGRHGESRDSILQLLASMDVGVIRVLEDLIDLLIRKRVIMITELPGAAQEKLRSRQQMRQCLDRESIIVDDIL